MIALQPRWAFYACCSTGTTTPDPSARLFRQPERGAWEAVIHDVHVSLNRWLGERLSG
jgi:hypothetical protein